MNKKTSPKNKTLSISKRIARRIIRDNENGARKSVLEDLFYDFHRSRREVYLMNFIRGVFFGFGSVLGATIIVAVLVWFLSQLVDVFPPLADFVNNLIDTMQRRR